MYIKDIQQRICQKEKRKKNEKNKKTDPILMQFLYRKNKVRKSNFYSV